MIVVSGKTIFVIIKIMGNNLSSKFEKKFLREHKSQQRMHSTWLKKGQSKKLTEGKGDLVGKKSCKEHYKSYLREYL